MVKCSITGVTAIRADSGYSYARHTHDQFGIGIIDSGAQRSASGRGPVEARQGDVITVNPGEVHDGAPIGGPRRWRMLYLDTALISAAIQDVGEGATTDYEFALPALHDRAAAETVHHLFAAATTFAENTNGMAFDEYLLGLVSHLTPRKLRHAHGKVPDIIALARMMIDDDPAAPITLQLMAEETGLSRFQLVRGFASAMGMTPHAYLIQQRVAKARQLIAAGYGLADAAFAAGFSDQSHMTRLFLRNFGVTPGKYASAHP